MNGTYKANNKTFRTGLIFFTSLLALFCFACDYDGVLGGSYNSVEYGLRGTWERTEQDEWLSGYAYGKLVIDYNTVTISGPIAQLQGFTRNTALEAYTENSYLFIKDKGEWQTPVAYNRWPSGGSYLQQDQMVTLGGVETLKRISN